MWFVYGGIKLSPKTLDDHRSCIHELETIAVEIQKKKSTWNKEPKKST
jgi:hypothetical protein